MTGGRPPGKLHEVTDSQSVAAPRRKRDRGRPDRRRALLDAARARFLADGFSNTSVSSIVRDAGVAQGTFYLYFKSKEHLLVHLRAEVLEDLLAAFERGIRGDAPADERLVRGLERIYAVIRRHRGLLRVIRQATSGDEIDRVWIEGRGVLAEPLAALIAEGAAAGAFAPDDPKMAAHLLLSLFDDLLFDALEYRVPASGRKTLVHATRFALRGLGVAPRRIERLCPLAKGSK